MLKRLFDIVFSVFGIILLSPFYIIISILITIDSRGSIFYRQFRVGMHGKEFKLFKFRTMRTDSDKSGLLTIGGRDSRITRMGYFLRKSKMDELPQLLNIFLGQMSFVGPRPEVSKYVAMYNEEQRKVLSVRPGLTDYASLAYINENEILGKSINPEETYINDIMPAKLELYLQYIKDQSFVTDLRLIIRTVLRLFRK